MLPIGTKLFLGYLLCINPTPNVTSVPYNAYPRVFTIDVDTLAFAISKVAQAEDMVDRPLALFKVHKKRKYCNPKPNGISEVCYVKGLFPDQNVAARVEHFNQFPKVDSPILPEVDIQISSMHFKIAVSEENKGLIFVHELLHTYYIDHTDTQPNIMTSSLTDFKPSILKKDINFLRCIIMDVNNEK